jgi:hypothetical protein
MQSAGQFKKEELAIEPPPYAGSWERSGRSINAAATLGLLGIGVFYFNAQGILVLIAIGLAHLSAPALDFSGDFMERLSSATKLYAGPIRIAIVVSQYLFMLLPAWWLVKRWHTVNVRDYVRFKRSSIWEILLAVIGTLAILPAGNYIANELTRRLNIPDTLLKINAELFTAHSFHEFIWLVFVIAFTPALCEEIFFRGFVQRTFERTMQEKSVLLIGVVFGLFHMQPLGLITLSLLGVVLGYFYYRSKSLLPAMAAHFTNNFVVILLLYRAPEIADVDLASTQQIPLLWVFATLPVVMGILFLYHKVTKSVQPR